MSCGRRRRRDALEPSVPWRRGRELSGVRQIRHSGGQRNLFLGLGEIRETRNPLGVKPGSAWPWDAAATAGAVLGHGTRRSGAYWSNCGREKVSKGCARVGSESANPSQGGVVAVLCCGEVRREELAEDAAARRRRAGSKLLGAPRATLACQKGRAGGVGPHRAFY